jgi:hypothetical protein
MIRTMPRKSKRLPNHQRQRNHHDHRHGDDHHHDDHQHGFLSSGSPFAFSVWRSMDRARAVNGGPL